MSIFRGACSVNHGLPTDLFFPRRKRPWWARTSSSMLHDHTQTQTTLGTTPLDEWSARRRDLYLTTHNTHKRQTSMPPVGFEPAIPASERPQTHILDRAATGIGSPWLAWCNYVHSTPFLVTVPSGTEPRRIPQGPCFSTPQFHFVQQAALQSPGKPAFDFNGIPIAGSQHKQDPQLRLKSKVLLSDRSDL
jgi:hypothetical protein